MKTLFSKILVGQVVAVVLALLVVTLITRVSLNQGFKDFLERQEATVLQALALALGDTYESRGSWDFLRDHPQNWRRIWRLSHLRQGVGPLPEGRRPGEPWPQDSWQGSPRPQHPGMQGEVIPDVDPPSAAKRLHWKRSADPGNLRQRLFLLDENYSRIAGAEPEALDGITLEAIQSDGQLVGWLGFTPAGKVLPPDAAYFLARQIKVTIISLAVALAVAAALAYLLARNVSRPVRRLGDTVRDLSQGEYLARVKVESRDEIGGLAAHVNQLADTLEKNRSARQRWMADIAHELRTPVTILKGEIEALADGVRQADERMSASLREEIDQLSALIDDLQTLALSDAGALHMQKNPLNLSNLVGQSVDSFQHRLEARQIQVDVELAHDVIIPADQPKIRQVLNNLLENSSRYVVEAGKVKVSLRQNQAEAELLLEDSGPGLEEEQIARLFERFYRVENSRSRASGGTGLGLSICKNIVEAHGGSIRAEHSALGGLKIRIVLPN